MIDASQRPASPRPEPSSVELTGDAKGSAAEGLDRAVPGGRDAKGTWGSVDDIDDTDDMEGMHGLDGMDNSGRIPVKGIGGKGGKARRFTRLVNTDVDGMPESGYLKNIHEDPKEN